MGVELTPVIAGRRQGRRFEVLEQRRRPRRTSLELQMHLKCSTTAEVTQARTAVPKNEEAAATAGQQSGPLQGGLGANTRGVR
jgi:hypothetical protein